MASLESLQGVFTGQSHLLDLRGLLAVWFGCHLSDFDEECDAEGVPDVLKVLAREHGSLPHRMNDWSVAGHERDDGAITACRRGSNELWCAKGSISTPVLTGYRGQVVEASKHLDRFLLASFLFEAHLDAPWELAAGAASPANAAAYLRDYSPVTGLVGVDLGGWWIRDDTLVQHLPPLGTLWPTPRLLIHARGRVGVDGAMSDLLVNPRWSRIDGSLVT